jgi:hypothetical protein
VFGFAQWDSPVALILEAALSLIIVAALLFVVRRVNARAEAEHKDKLNSLNQDSAEGSVEKSNDQHTE